MEFQVRCPHGILKYVKSSKLRDSTHGTYTCRGWRNCPTFRISVSPEFRTAILHYECIRRGLSGYKGMPFYKPWRPNKKLYCRTFEAAAMWIRENLGPRPIGASLHVIDHEKGFVPGNLEWTYPRKQVNQQMYKIIAQLKHRIKILENRLGNK